jgi:hypothetical protein
MKTFFAIIGKILKAIGVLFAFVLAFAFLAPIVYFSWRAGQPMSMPEYDSRTYYELLVERRQAYDGLAREYQASHPSVDVKLGACFSTEIGVELMEIPMSFFYALLSMYPNLQHSIDPRDIQNGYIPEDVTWVNVVPSTWKVF